MANGGSRKPVADEGRGHERSRTAVVIDHLLSRGPMTATLVTAAVDSDTADGAEPWVSVFPVLRRTAPSILEGHLTWLVARVEGDDPRSSPAVVVEDQTRILIRALEHGGEDEDEIIIRALEQPWNAAIVSDDDEDIARYASDLRAATAGQPDTSPFVALALSADDMADELFDLRGSTLARRRVG
jgi:hypothetical protein